MRVLMINTNRLRVPQPVLPIGMCLVADAARSDGHSVELLDLCFDKNPQMAVQKAISRFNPEVVGLSVRNLDNSDAVSPSWYLEEVRSVVQAVRESSYSPIVIGGPGVSIAPRSIRSYLGVDYAVAGEGEEVFPQMLAQMEAGKTPKTDDGVISASLTTTTSVGSCMRVLSRSTLKRYAAYGTPAAVQTKRGCSYKCVYCTYPSIEGSSYRLKSPSIVADEIAEVTSSDGFRSVEFTDAVFNCPSAHFTAVCEELARRGSRVPLHSTTINPSCASAQSFRLMERAGFVAISSSLESASDEVLNAMGKGYTAREVAETVTASRMTGMARMWTFMLGGPGETERTVGKTLDFIRKNLDGRDFTIITCGIRVYPGTKLEGIAKREGVIGEADDLLHPAFYFAPGLSLSRLVELVAGAGLNSNTTALSSELGSPILPFVQRMHTLLRLKPPYWRYAAQATKLRGRK